MERGKPPVWAIILFVLSFIVFFAIGLATSRATFG